MCVCVCVCVYSRYMDFALVNFIFPEEERYITDRNTHNMVSRRGISNFLARVIVAA